MQPQRSKERVSVPKINKRLISIALILTMFWGSPVYANSHDQPRITLTASNSAIIDLSGNLWVWGFGRNGELGNGKNQSRNKPIKVMTNVRSVAFCDMANVELEQITKGTMFVVKKDDTLWACGYNQNGIYGNGSTKSHNKLQMLMDNVQSVYIAHNPDPIVFVMKTDQSLWGWGQNSYGDLGIESDTTFISKPQKILSEVKNIYFNQTAYAIKSNDELWIWGKNLYEDKGLKQLSETYYIPKPIKLNSDVKQVAASSSFLLILMNNAVLSQAINKPVGIASFGRPYIILRNIERCDTAYNNCYAITKDHSLYTWGYNYLGELGIGHNQAVFTPTKVFDNVSKVTLGNGNIFIIDKNNKLYMSGKILDNQTSSFSPVMSNVAEVVICNGTVIAMKMDGSIWTWGENKLGLCGNGSTKNISAPIKLKFS